MTQTTVTLNGNEHTISKLTGRKVFTALSILRTISRDKIPEIMQEWYKFERDYRDQNSFKFDRATAKMQFGDSLDHLSDSDWERSGNTVTLPRSPTQNETVVAVLPRAIELAEVEVMRLLALLLMSNEDAKRYGREGILVEKLDERREELEDADFDELIELAVVAAEAIDGQVRSKVEELGDRTGKLLKVVGLSKKDDDDQKSTTPTSQTSQPTSSTSSPEPTVGEQTSLTSAGT